MKWVVIVVAGVAALVAIVVLIGALLPREHVATSTVTIRQPPETVWAVVSDLGGVAAWWPELRRAERLPDKDGRPVWRHEMKNGFAMALVVAQAEAPRRLVTQIDAPPGAAFGGSWIYEIGPADGGSRVSVTERGWIANPIFRFMSHVIFGYYGTLDGYVTQLGKRLGQEVTPMHR